MNPLEFEALIVQVLFKDKEARERLVPFLEPTLFDEEKAETLSISLLIEDRLPIENFMISSSSYPFEIIEGGSTLMVASIVSFTVEQGSS